MTDESDDATKGTAGKHSAEGNWAEITTAYRKCDQRRSWWLVRMHRRGGRRAHVDTADGMGVGGTGAATAREEAHQRYGL